jgi:Ran GTPase-activating protein 1
MRLTHFSAGRDRLENKGITALAAVFKQQASLEVLEVPQNGIKKDGMLALLDALKSNAGTLREVYLHDNWIKQTAIDGLLKFVLSARTLQRLNISDSTMGSEGGLLLAKALVINEETKKGLKWFGCNYNEVESGKISARILDYLSHMEGLETVEFKGNTISKKLAQGYISRFEGQGIKLVMYDEEEEEEEDEEEEEENEDEEEGAEDEDLVTKLEKLRE